jgi:hypothetical protein
MLQDDSDLAEAERWLQEEQEWHKANGCPAVNPGTVILDELARLRGIVASQASERDRLWADNEAYCQHEVERAAEVLDLKQQLASQASELVEMRGENLAKDAALAEIAAAIREGVAKIEYKSKSAVNRLAVSLDSAETIGQGGHHVGEGLEAMRDGARVTVFVSADDETDAFSETLNGQWDRKPNREKYRDVGAYQYAVTLTARKVEP